MKPNLLVAKKQQMIKKAKNVLDTSWIKLVHACSTQVFFLAIAKSELIQQEGEMLGLSNKSQGHAKWVLVHFDVSEGCVKYHKIS